MSDQQAQPQSQQQAAPQQAAPLQAAPLAQFARPAPAKKSVVAKLASAVAGHAYMSLAVIVVLVILIIGMYVYYHGLLFLGPYASRKAGFKSKSKGKKGKDKDSDDEDDVKGDPETEKLIQSINQQ